MIKAEKLSKIHQQQELLKDVSFDLADGKVLGILGPNGSGKTTLLKILALVSQPDRGEVFIHGEPTRSKNQHLRSLIGYVPQDIALYEDLSVQDNLICWSTQPLAQARQTAQYLMQTFHLDQIARKPVRLLSGGMKRRVNLAVALLNQPRLLILDEPLVGVDIRQREAIIRELLALKQQGVTQVITTHHAGEILDLVDQVMILNLGLVSYYADKSTFQQLLESHHYNTDLAILSTI